MRKILGIVVLGLLLTILQSCSSTGVKDISQLSAPSSTEANVYFKRTGGFVLGVTRAIIKVDGTEFGSLNTHDFLKINVQPGNRILTVAGDPYGGVFGKTDISISLQAGKSYYFVTSVRAVKGLGIFMGEQSDKQLQGDLLLFYKLQKVHLAAAILLSQRVPQQQ